MSRRVGTVCAGLALWALAGCSMNSFLATFTGADGRQQVVSGSVDQVSARLQAAFSRANVLVNVNREEQDIRISGVSKGGRKFTLVLHQRPTHDGSQSTVVGVEWGSSQGADEELWTMVVRMLLLPASAWNEAPQTHAVDQAAMPGPNAFSPPAR